MTVRRWEGVVRARATLGVVAFAILLAACAGASDQDASTSADTEAAPAPAVTEPAAAGATSEESGPVGNACPADGCQITITDVTSEGDELAVTWEANFAPDGSRNHIHVYWDTYDAAQVSSDAEANGLTQGDWVPTDAYPTYVTEGVVSVDSRGDSTTLCVTAADRDHAVLDSTVEDCADVADVLEG